MGAAGLQSCLAAARPAAAHQSITHACPRATMVHAGGAIRPRQIHIRTCTAALYRLVLPRGCARPRPALGLVSLSATQLTDAAGGWRSADAQLWWPREAYRVI